MRPILEGWGIKDYCSFDMVFILLKGFVVLKKGFDIILKGDEHSELYIKLLKCYFKSDATYFRGVGD